MNKFIKITLQLNDENFIFDIENVVEEKICKIGREYPIIPSQWLCKEGTI